MAELLAATAQGVFAIQQGRSKREEGPADAHILAHGADATYAITDEAALWRRDSAGWRLVSRQTVPDEIWSFAAHPRIPGRLYLGVSPALLYRSDDGGLTWTACESLKRMPGYETWTFPPPPHIPHVRSIAADPGAAGAIYIGVEEGGVFRSPDGGDTWESLNEGLYWDVHTVIPASAGPDLYATTGAGFHYSSDSGAHWQHVPLPHRYTVPLLASRSTTGALYTVAAEGPPPTWVKGVRGALYRSPDGGRSWRRLEKGLPQQLERMASALIEDGTGRVCASVGDQVFCTNDSGESWQVLVENLPEVRSLISVP
jgi:photosystem II stability/assembly factor-like uncharacterized protein